MNLSTSKKHFSKLWALCGAMAATAFLSGCGQQGGPTENFERSDYYTRGIGQYPGDPKEDFSPDLKPDQTYRNLELLRSAFNSSSSASFEELRMYVESKLLWDTSLNYYDLAKDFIMHYYGAAGEKVLQYFNENFSHMISQIAESQITQGPFGNLSQAKYWPFEFLARMSDILNEGEAMYEPLKETDREAYDVYVNIIRQQ